jgi:hypothetical protein
MILTGTIVGGIQKAQIKVIIKKMQPFIDKISHELHSVYTEYSQMINDIRKTNFIEKLKKRYNDTISIKEDTDINITEKDFINTIINHVAVDIKHMKSGKKGINPSPTIQTWYGGFDTEKVAEAIYGDDELDGGDWEDYLEYIYEITQQVQQVIEKYKHFKYLFDLAGDDLAFYWFVEIRYNISEELRNEILKAVKGK